LALHHLRTCARLPTLIAVRAMEGAEMAGATMATEERPGPLQEVGSAVFNRREALSVSISAGLGAAFFYLLWLSLIDFASLSAEKEFDEGLAIVLVAIGVVKFLEPLTVHARRALHIAGETHAVIPKTTRNLQWAAFGVIVATSLIHGLLHSLMEKNSSGGLGIVVAGIVLAGGVTYCWAIGAKREPPRAAVFGYLAGLVLGSVFLFLLLATQAQFATVETFLKLLVFNGGVWGIAGLCGGLAIEKRWLAQPSVAAGVALVVPVFILDSVLLLLGWITIPLMLNDIARLVGWALGLIVHPAADRVLAIRPQAVIAPSGVAPKDAVPYLDFGRR